MHGSIRLEKFLPKDKHIVRRQDNSKPKHKDKRIARKFKERMRDVFSKSLSEE